MCEEDEDGPIGWERLTAPERAAAATLGFCEQTWAHDEYARQLHRYPQAYAPACDGSCGAMHTGRRGKIVRDGKREPSISEIVYVRDSWDESVVYCGQCVREMATAEREAVGTAERPGADKSLGALREMATAEGFEEVWMPGGGVTV